MSTFVKGLGDTVGIVGMGLSGTAALNLIKQIDPGKKVLTFDAKEGAADWSNLDEMLSKNPIKSLIVSPGVPLNLPSLQRAAKSGVRITSELAIAQSCLSNEKIIAVTGSVGKSTTVALLESALKSLDPNSLAVGNIGKPLAEYTLEVLQGTRPRASWLALELSSYQLENYENLVADVSIITFFTANHLERYKSIQDYYQTKWSLVNKTRGTVFLNKESLDLVRFSKNAGLNAKIKFCSPADPEIKSLNLKDSSLLGAHNQQNLALVGHFILGLGRGSSCLTAIKNFSGLSHRLENLGQKKGVLFVNDSKATALDSVYSAISSLYADLPSGKILYVLIGGKDKNLPWDWLSNLSAFNSLKIIYFGECAQKAKSGTKIEGPVFSKLEDAIDLSLSLVKSGDILLLSPGGTSLDEFKSFEDRGNFFKNKVSQFS